MESHSILMLFDCVSHAKKQSFREWHSWKGNYSILIYTFKTRTRKAQSSGCIFFLHIEEHAIKGAIRAEKTERNPWVLDACAKKTIIHEWQNKRQLKGGKKHLKKNKTSSVKCCCLCISLTHCRTFLSFWEPPLLRKTEKPWVLKAYAKNNLSMSNEIKDN